MKKVLFLQIKGKSYAGVWNVNKLVGESLIKRGYVVHIVSIRNNQNDIILQHDPKLIVKTINEKDIWESYHLNDIVCELREGHFIKGCNMTLSKIKHNMGIKKDIKKLHKYIYEYVPDYIVTSHYELLDMIPREYLNRTIHEQHSSLIDALSNKANKRTFDKYRDKIKFLWLSEKTMENAIDLGYYNSDYIYNAVRISSNKLANVKNNKKLVTISRLSKDKSLDKMINIVSDVFSDHKYHNWILEIYGDGGEKNYLQSIIKNKEQIKLMGLTDSPKEVLLNSSINLNTSLYEGFSLSILEACECGVPTIAFNFGESAPEEIIDGKTGYLVSDDSEYKEKLMLLMDNGNLLLDMSKNAKQFANNFKVDPIIDKWVKLFDEMDGG